MRGWGLALLALVSLPARALDEAALLEELRALKARVTELERQLEARQRETLERQTTLEQESARPAVVAAAEPAPEPASKPEAPAPELTIGGALRLNYAWLDYDGSNDRLGSFEMELFRLDVKAESGPLSLSAQYRWYNDFEAVQHAWIGYRFDPEWQLQLGISQVPFGLLPYASHSFWFGATYYLGFEDDYDTGLKLLYEGDPWQWQLAFYKNAEYANAGRFDRYSFDVARGGEQQNEEADQFNLRGSYRWAHGADSHSEVGASLQWGRLYNHLTDDHGDRHALALHWDGHYGPWNLQLQWIDYRFAPDNPATVPDDTVQLAAFGFPFLVAAQGQVWTLNVARQLPFRPGPVEAITCYNDFSRVAADGRGQRPSLQNVSGCLLQAGAVYAYLDWIAGRNMWFAGGPGIGLDDGEWRSRLNLNIGYYW